MESGADLVAWSAEGRIMAGIAALAVLLSGVGVYAGLSQAAAQRRKERHGTRCDVGLPRTRRVPRRDRSALGVAGGVLAALALARYIMSLLYGIGALEPPVLGGVTGFMFVVAPLATVRCPGGGRRD